MLKLYHSSFNHSVHIKAIEHRVISRSIEDRLKQQVKKDYPKSEIELFSSHYFTDADETIVCLVFRIEEPATETKVKVNFPMPFL